jgi:alanyl-tRNA synthetase
MQYENNEEGKNFKRLPTLCVDTGMGLERLASILQVNTHSDVHFHFHSLSLSLFGVSYNNFFLIIQGKSNNFDIDTFSLIIAAVRSLILKRTKQQYSVHSL